MAHLLEQRYRAVWERTKNRDHLSGADVAASRFYFEFKDGPPVPRRFDTYAIVCGLPFQPQMQRALHSYWRRYLATLSSPLAYGVEPANLHTEIFLFQRPEETFGKEQVDAAIAESLTVLREMSLFRLIFRHPFITPDGTIVAPGYDEPAGVVEALRMKLRENLQIYPKKQSQWVHVSLGRILEPVDQKQWRSLLEEMDLHWGEIVGEAEIGDCQVLWEKQWYMMEREQLHRVAFKAG